jgi:hypothetical protein
MGRSTLLRLDDPGFDPAAEVARVEASSERSQDACRQVCRAGQSACTDARSDRLKVTRRLY